MRSNWRVVILALAIAFSSVHAQVRVWEESLTLPTCEEGLPDPSPPFDQFAANRFNYPYTLRDNLTSHRVDHDWRAVFPDNEYLKCSPAQKLPGIDQQQWQSRLQKALADVVGRTETSGYPSWWMYTAGMLERDLGKKQEANARFRRVLLLPDRMLAYHLTRLAQLDTSRK
jgi:hypothetical protein